TQTITWPWTAIQLEFPDRDSCLGGIDLSAFSNVKVVHLTLPTIPFPETWKLVTPPNCETLLLEGPGYNLSQGTDASYGVPSNALCLSPTVKNIAFTGMNLRHTGGKFPDVQSLKVYRCAIEWEPIGKAFSAVQSIHLDGIKQALLHQLLADKTWFPALTTLYFHSDHTLDETAVEQSFAQRKFKKFRVTFPHKRGQFYVAVFDNGVWSEYNDR